MKLKRGMKVAVYEDPATRTILEGTAILNHRGTAYPSGNLEHWDVQFFPLEDGDMLYPRWICAEDVIPMEAVS